MLGEAADGTTQLPDFQRGWVWDDEHVRSLLASISLGYPIGAVMMLRAGGETVRFKQRPLEGAPAPGDRGRTAYPRRATAPHINALVKQHHPGARPAPGHRHGCARGQRRLRDKLNDAIASMNADGSLNKLIRKWVGEDAKTF